MMPDYSRIRSLEALHNPALADAARRLLAVSVVLAFALPLAAAPAAWAGKKDKPDTAPNAAKAQHSDRKAAPRKRPEAPPVLDENARKAIIEEARKLDPDSRSRLSKFSDALHHEGKAIGNELHDDEELATTDIGMLWAAAVEHSGRIRFAIEKLSRRDATGQPVDNDSFSKKMVQNLVQLGGVAGSMWTKTPAGLLGSNAVQDMISGDPAQSALTRVTDTDMVLLAKEVETLQSQLLTLYYDYRHTRERLNLAQEATGALRKYYDRATAEDGGATEALLPLVDSIYDSAKQGEINAQQAFANARNALALLVGAEAVAALEKTSAQNKAAQADTLP